MKLKIGLRAFSAVEHRLFDEENRMLLGETREKLLRALPDESPAQVREDHDAVTVGALDLDRGIFDGRDGRQLGAKTGRGVGAAQRRGRGLGLAISIAVLAARG